MNGTFKIPSLGWLAAVALHMVWNALSRYGLAGLVGGYALMCWVLGALLVVLVADRRRLVRLIREHLPAYLTWDQYLRNQERLRQNQSHRDTLGPPRNGCALLCGLVECARCRWHMEVSYRTRDQPYYHCVRHLAEGTDRPCFGVSANVLDDLVAQQVLRALEPAALDLSVQAQADLRKERERLDRLPSRV